MRYAVKKHMKS